MVHSIAPMTLAKANAHRSSLPNLGLGLGLRNVHFEHILKHWPKLDWFEAISENFMDSGGRPRYILDQIAEHYPVVLHGVSMSIGSTDPLNRHYLAKLKKLADAIDTPWISDHLCWTGILGLNTHDLLPLPLTDETLNHVIERVRTVQDILERPLILENPSTYLTFRQSTLEETEFFSQLAAATGCGFLLDVNNVFVSCYNAGTDPAAYIDAFPCENVVQMHLAGHQDCGDHIIDTHDGIVRQEVWALFARAWQRTGGSSVLLEWDSNIPAFDICKDEMMKARLYIDNIAEQPAPMTESERHKAQSPLSTPVDFMVAPAMDDAVLIDS